MKYLLQVEIKVYKKGTVSAPVDGLVVESLDSVIFECAGLPANEILFKKSELVWYAAKLKHDGTWIEKEEGVGQIIEKSTFGPGIYRVKLKIKGQAEIQFTRKTSDEGIHPATGYPTAWGPARVGQPDAFGVVLGDKQIALRNAAKAFVGTNSYDRNVGVTAQYGFSAVPAQRFLCNIFVAHRGCESGATVPAINHGLTGLRDYPPTANQWAGIDDTCYWIPDVQTLIAGWALMDNTEDPQPGMIVADPDPGGTGHCGIIDYDGQAISASSSSNLVSRVMSTLPGYVYRNYAD